MWGGGTAEPGGEDEGGECSSHQASDARETLGVFSKEMRQNDFPCVISNWSPGSGWVAMKLFRQGLQVRKRQTDRAGTTKNRKFS